MNHGSPFPLTKKACLSAWVSGTSGEKILLLDGHNNLGFSGGPVIVRERDSQPFKVCGVVSAYMRGLEPTLIEGNDQELRLWQNSGIVAYSGK